MDSRSSQELIAEGRMPRLSASRCCRWLSGEGWARQVAFMNNAQFAVRDTVRQVKANLGKVLPESRQDQISIGPQLPTIKRMGIEFLHAGQII